MMQQLAKHSRVLARIMHPTQKPHANANAATRAQQAAQALTSALAGPYQYSSHYAQAHHSQQASPSTFLRTPEGYSYSSTYAPSVQPQLHQFSENSRTSRGTYGLQNLRGGGNRFQEHRGRPQPTHWYEPGDCRCTYEQCAFTGSKKSVEIHMMDRHLIYPPGWRKPKNDWDADPSLKNGKPIPIQGTNLVLNTPEAVEVWIAERKKRWPTASRVEDKEKKLKDALERGEISACDPNLRGRKRPRTDDRGGQTREGGRGRGRSGKVVQASRIPIVHPLPMKPVTTVPVKVVEPDEDSSSSGSDVDPEKDIISSKPPPGSKPEAQEAETSTDEEIDVASKDVPSQPIKVIHRKPVTRPKVPIGQKNPFGNRPSLLRNLLLPEIRMTVSNLSQAIHFLVENDFLQDVELNPGDADKKPIEVISETNHDYESTPVPSPAQGRNNPN